MYRKQKRIPTIIAILILCICVIGVTVFIDRSQHSNITSAKEVSVPSDIHFSNISDNSFNISWFTSSPSLGSAVVINNSQKITYLDDLDNDNIPRPRTNHYITIKNLVENTVYTVIVSTGSQSCNNTKICPTFTQKTGNKLPRVNALPPIHGSFITKANQPVNGAIIYLSVGKSALLSGRTDSAGLWVIPLNNLRTSDLLGRIEISDNDIIQITAKIDPNQLSTGVIDIRSVRNNITIPPLIIGNNHNFINFISKNSLMADSDNQKILGTQIDNSDKPISVSKVKLNYDISFPLYDDDTTTDSQPRFRGTGIKNTPILITVNSSPQTARIVVSNDGNWTWRPPEFLAPGNHSISIQAYDEKGGLITVTRKFIVLKSGERVLGEATNSATLTPSIPSPTKISTPTIISSPTLIPSPTTILSPTQSLTPTNIVLSPTKRPPATGNTQTTLVLMGGSGVLILLGISLFLIL